MDEKTADDLARAFLTPDGRTGRMLQAREQRTAVMRARRPILLAGLVTGATGAAVLAATTSLPVGTVIVWSLLGGLGAGHFIAAWRHPLPRP